MFTNYRAILAATAFGTLLSDAVLAQEPVEMTDPYVGMTTTLGGGFDWQYEVDLAGEQSTITIFHQDGEQLIAMQVLTMMQVNPAALSEDPEQVRYTTEQFLTGLCGPFACAKAEGDEYIAIGDRNAWVLETQLGLADYQNLGIGEAIMLATTTPQGYMQLFSAHAAPDQITALRDVLIATAAEAVFE